MDLKTKECKKCFCNVQTNESKLKIKVFITELIKKSMKFISNVN